MKFHTNVKTCIGQFVFIRTFAAEKVQLSHACRGEKIPQGEGFYALNSRIWDTRGTEDRS